MRLERSLSARIVALALVVVVGSGTLAVSGCSFLLVEPPPKPDEIEPGEYPDCTHSQTLPAVDGISAGLLLILGLTTVGQTDESGFGTTLAVPAIFASVPYGISSYVGFRRTLRCDRLRAAETKRRVAVEQWRMRREAAAGEENGMCLSDGDGWRCNQGLTCVRYQCVKAPEPKKLPAGKKPPARKKPAAKKPAAAPAASTTPTAP